MNHFRFSRKTFKYFEEAQQNEDSRSWFDLHKAEYEESVIVPFTHLIVQMKETFGDLVPGIEISAKKIVKPLRRQIVGLSEPLIRSKTTAFFSNPLHRTRTDSASVIGQITLEGRLHATA